MLRGEYDTGVPPDKRPKVPKGPGALGFSGERRGARTVQMINVWKADSAFAALARSPTLGRLVAQTAGWASGARLAQDQAWATDPNPSPSPSRSPSRSPNPSCSRSRSPSPSPSPNPDQVWAKPPGAPPLVFHRDSPYFDFAPSDVVTVAPS